QRRCHVGTDQQHDADLQGEGFGRDDPQRNRDARLIHNRREMKMLTEAMLRAMARGQPNAANLNSVLVALQKYGQNVGLEKPSRIAQYLAQVLHESGSFRYDRELWGPTPAQ